MIQPEQIEGGNPFDYLNWISQHPRQAHTLAEPLESTGGKICTQQI